MCYIRSNDIPKASVAFLHLYLPTVNSYSELPRPPIYDRGLSQAREIDSIEASIKANIACIVEMLLTE